MSKPQAQDRKTVIGKGRTYASAITRRRIDLLKLGEEDDLVVEPLLELRVADQKRLHRSSELQQAKGRGEHVRQPFLKPDRSGESSLTGDETRSWAVFWNVFFVSSCRAALCFLPRGVRGASRTVDHDVALVSSEGGGERSSRRKGRTRVVFGDIVLRLGVSGEMDYFVGHSCL